MIEHRQISLNDTFVQRTGNIVSDMGGEKVMLSIKNGKYYNLGEIGGKIWDHLAQPLPASLIVKALMSEYEVEQAECERQVVSFLEHLLAEGLIQ